MERLAAFMMQIGLSILVLYALKESKNVYLILEILLHALADFPAGLYQLKIINSMFAIEVLILTIAAIAVVYIVKSKEVFKRKE